MCRKSGVAWRWPLLWVSLVEIRVPARLGYFWSTWGWSQIVGRLWFLVVIGLFFFFSPPVFLLAVSCRLLSAPRYHLHSLPFGFLHLQNEKQRISVASNPHPYPIFEALSPGGDKFLLQPQLIRSGLLKAHWKYLPVLRSADLALLSYLYILLHSSTRLVSDWVTGRKGWENFAYKRGGNILGAIPNSTYYSSRVHHD